ncbi:CubicO group peptidase, beta-lactamase class C family [Streptomyces sp. TLI_053]|uniref:serine hydrolase domain-containing protein n=1 Tax=Streptomyces sp. TLI_053 TaxID=1855352 RepID=UPI00087A7A6B|nr:serine hydrolase domain-containing protein [Streptomyces sp. TLI_053]SDT68456.1 CubicO group peptidase, beta-lactamase class C family [Streptomyces sp. TLI_053]
MNAPLYGPPDPELDRLLRPLFRAAAPAGGAAVVVIRGDQRTVACRGHAVRSTERPVRADTRFELGSVTKTFTGLLLAEMAARGEVGYDDPIDRYLPADAAPGYPQERPITLLHLATHTSGLPRLPDGVLPGQVPRWFTRPYATFGPAHLLRALPRTAVRGTPGTQVRYSNLGCGLLGLLLANAAGQRYDDLLAARVCGPLGLMDTSCGPGREEDAGYRRGRRVPSFRLPALPAAAALRSTADDMLRYLQAHLALDAVPLPERADAAVLRTALNEVRRPRTDGRRGGPRICLGWNHRALPAGAAEPRAAARPAGASVAAVGASVAGAGASVAGAFGRSGAAGRAGVAGRPGAAGRAEAAGWAVLPVPVASDGAGPVEAGEVVYHVGADRGSTAFVGFSPRVPVGLAVLAGGQPLRSRALVQSAHETLRVLIAEFGEG